MVDALTSEALRKLAADEYAWAESRMVTYREDAAPIPDPIRRCHGLASAVLAYLPTMGTMGVSRKDAARTDKAVDDLRHAREGIYALSMMIQTLNATLDGASLPAQSLAEPGVLSDKGSDVGTDANPSPATAQAGTVAGAADGASPMTGIWPGSGIYHGLVLVNATGERRLFAEPIKGQFVVQTVASDGLTAGKPWSTMADKWPADAWTWSTDSTLTSLKPALRRYDDATGKAKEKPPAADRTMALPGMSDVVPAKPAETPRKTIADYDPGAVQFQTWTAAFSKAAGKMIDETRVRESFASWQAANATESKPNPAAAFWQHARGVLVGQPAT